MILTCSNIKNLHIDIETYSNIDIKFGVYKYVQSPLFEILMIAYKIDEQEVELLDLKQGDIIPGWFIHALKDKKVIKHAFNAQFERICLSKYLDLSLKVDYENCDWRCSMIHAATLNLPQSLKKCAEYLKICEQKDSAGVHLINYFSKPSFNMKGDKITERRLPEDNPTKWELFKSYCMQDVNVEYKLSKKLSAFPMIKEELQLYAIDQEINDRGVKVDKELVYSVLKIMLDISKRKKHELEKITSLKNPNSIKQFQAWLNIKGIYVASLDRRVVTSYLKETKNISEEVRKALEIRLYLSNSSIKKYDMLKNILGPDDRIRGILQFYGATKTGRWAGRLLQVQNLPKNKIKDLNTARQFVKTKNIKDIENKYKNAPGLIKQLIRTSLVAKKDYTFYICDYSSIEARVLAWFAKEKWVLDVFKGHGKIYEATAAKMFNLPIDKVDSELRQKGKVANLALGYQGSIGALKSMGAIEMGLTEEELKPLVDDWRKANKKIVQYWWNVEKAAKNVIENKTLVRINKLKFRYNKGFLFIKLPSGRSLAYPKARLEDDAFSRKIVYEGKGLSVNMEKLKTYGGKLVENIIQATARDILAEALKRLKLLNIDIVFHVHDEIVCEIPKSEKEYYSHLIKQSMKANPIWAEGLPIDAEGYISDYYKK